MSQSCSSQCLKPEALWEEEAAHAVMVRWEEHNGSTVGMLQRGRGEECPPGQENKRLCGSQMVAGEGLRSRAGLTAQVRVLKEAQCALRFKLKPLLLQRDSLVLSLLTFSIKDSEWQRLQINLPAGFLVCHAAEVRTITVHGATEAGAPPLPALLLNKDRKR